MKFKTTIILTILILSLNSFQISDEPNTTDFSSEYIMDSAEALNKEIDQTKQNSGEWAKPDTNNYQGFVSSFDRFVNQNTPKEIIFSDSLQRKLVNTPKYLMDTTYEILILTFDSRNFVDSPELKIYQAEQLSILPMSIVNAPLSAVDGFRDLPGLTGIYLDQYWQFIGDEWFENQDKDPSMDFEIQTYPSEQRTGGRDLLDLGIDGSGITIAIVDTGIDKNHPDLNDLDGIDSTNDPKVILEKSFIDFDNDGIADLGPEDQAGHGTHVAGIAAANGVIKGMAPGSNLINARVLDRWGGGRFTWIMQGLDWAASQGADIISMSLGGFFGDVQPLLNTAVDAAWESGSMIVISAGNSGPGLGTISSPGLSSRALTVGATDIYDKVTYWSSRGPSSTGIIDPDIVAPGDEIFSTILDNSYGVASGTSMAAPSVSGGLALLLSAYPNVDIDVVRSALLQSATDIGRPLFQQGAGFLDLVSAYNLLSGTVPYYAFPSFNPTSPLVLSPGEIFTYQLDIFIDPTDLFDPNIEVVGPVFDVSILNIETNTRAWRRAEIQVQMPSSGVNGYLNITDNLGNYLVSANLTLELDLVQDDLGSGTDAGETFSGSLSLTLGSQLPAYITESDYVDWYEFEVDEGTSYSVLLDDLEDDFDLFLHNENGSMFAWSFNWDTNLEMINFTAISSGNYTLRVVPFYGYGGYSIGYSIGTGSVATLLPAQLTGNYNNRRIDNDTNGLFEEFVFEVEVNVQVEGNYDFLYSVAQSRTDYNFPLYTFFSEYLTFYLEVGITTVDLYVPGDILEASGYNGQYILNDLLLGDPSTWTILNYETSIESSKTSNYQSNLFEPAEIRYQGYTLGSRNIDGVGNPEVLLLTISFYIPTPGNYYIELYLIDESQYFLIDWVSNDFEALTAGNYLVEFEFYVQFLRDQGDIIIAGLYIETLSGLIPIFDTITQTSLEGYDTIIDLVISDRLIDTNINGIADSMELVYSINSKISFDANFFASFAISLVNESALPLYGDNSYGQVGQGFTEITIEFPLNIFIARNISGPFLFPFVGLYGYGENFSNSFGNTHITQPYTTNDLEPPIAYVSSVGNFSTYDIGYDGGIAFDIVIESTEQIILQVSSSIRTYNPQSGWFYDSFYIDMNLEMGTNIVTVNISGKEIYMYKFIGDLEISSISLREISTYKQIDYLYRVGIIEGIDYNDYFLYADAFFNEITMELIDIDLDGLYEGANFTLNWTVQIPGDFRISMDLVGEEYWGWYYDYSSLTIATAGDYIQTFYVPASILVRNEIIGNSYSSFSINSLNTVYQWNDNQNQKFYIDGSLLDYTLPVIFTSLNALGGVDSSLDGLFNSFDFEINLNIVTESSYSFSIGYRVEISFENNIWFFYNNVETDWQILNSGMQTINISIPSYDFARFISWIGYSSDDDLSGMKIDFYVSRIVVEDSLGFFRIIKDDIFLAGPLDINLFDLRLPVDVINLEIEWADNNNDGIVNEMIVSITLKIQYQNRIRMQVDLNLWWDSGYYNTFSEVIVDKTENELTLEIKYNLISMFAENNFEVPLRFSLGFYFTFLDYDSDEWLGSYSEWLELTKSDVKIELTTTTTSSTTITASTITIISTSQRTITSTRKKGLLGVNLFGIFLAVLGVPILSRIRAVHKKIT